MDITVYNYWASMLATTAFAMTGVLAVCERDIDIFGAFFLGVVTAIGGGTIRDLILDVPVFWAVDQSYVWVALFSSIFAYVGASFLRHRIIFALLLYLDSFGAALFAVHATGNVWSLDFGLPIVPVMLGVITAIGGGLLRDVLAGHTTLLMRREIYAIPVLLGCTVYLLLISYYPEHQVAGAMVCTFFTFILRATAIHWKLSMPSFKL